MRGGIITLLALLLSLPVCAQTKAEKAASDLAGRILPRLHSGIEFAEVPSQEDFYELESVGGKIRISGNSAWGKFPVEYNPWHLNPNDPLYPRIQKLFFQDQKALSETDPDAVWLQMSWLFFHKHKNWTPERIAAYIKPVPAHRLIMLDYYCDKEEIYKLLKAGNIIIL